MKNIKISTCFSEKTFYKNLLLYLRKKYLCKKNKSMSTAEITARNLYDSMHLANMSEDVKRYLMILMLSESESISVPSSYEEALSMGAINLEDARKELHSYADELSVKYGMK